MADVLLTKPEAGSQQTVETAPDSKYVFDFPNGEGVWTRDGDNLDVKFDDGSSVRLQNFYTQYNSENMPTFNMGGDEVSALDFLTAMNDPELIPAAGPGAGAGGAAAGGGRFREYANAALGGGIDHLNGLDWNMSRAFDYESDVNSVGLNTDNDTGAAITGIAGQPVIPPLVNNPVTVRPVNPGDVPAGTPDLPLPGMPVTPSAGNPALGNGVGAERDILRAYESDLAHGKPVVHGGMTITAPDGLASIVVGGVTVWQNGQIVPDAEIRTDEGVLNNFQYDPDTGTLTYDFTLEQSTPEHGDPGKDYISHSVPVTVTDVDGDSDTSNITIVIQDDVPQAFPDFNQLKEGETVTASVVIGIDGRGTDTWGEDGPGAFNENGEFDPNGTISVKWDVPEGTEKQTGPDGRGYYEVTTPEGVAKLYDDGTYEFTASNLPDLKPGDTPPQVQFNYSIVDADGDISQSTLTITIDPVNNPVTLTPDNPGTVDPGTPPDDPDNPDNPDDPDNPVPPSGNDPGDTDNPPHPEDKPGDPDDPDNPLVPNPGASVQQSVLVFDEKDLRDGEPVTITDTMTVDAPDGVGAIEVGGKVVWQDGGLVPEEDRTFDTDEGHLVITGFDPDTGKLTYEYTLTDPTTEHDRPGTDDISHTFPVKVTDVDGDSAESYITIIVRDDVPEANPDKGSVKEGESISANVIVGVEGQGEDVYGADGPGAFNENGEFDPNGTIAVKWDVPEGTEKQTDPDGRGYYEVTTPEGVAKLYDDGSYDFTAGKNVPGAEGENTAQVQFNYSIVDKDGDISETTLTITIIPDNRTPDITPDPSYPDPDPVPDPDDPDNPDEPEDRQPVQPENNGGRVIVDEGALVKGGSGDSEHGASGKGSYQINLHGESGDVTMTLVNAAGQTETVTFHLENNSEGKVEFTPATFTLANGVTMTMTGATQNGADGPWTVNFDYALTGAQTHADPNAVGAGDVLDTVIGIEVMDETGDKASSHITVTVHDDGPKFGSETAGAKYDLNGDFNLHYGADQAALAGALTAEGATNTQVDGNKTIFTFEDGTLTVTDNGHGDFSYAFVSNTPNITFTKNITLTATDRDGDTDSIKLTVGLNHNPDITPDDPDTPKPDPNDPNDPGIFIGNIVVDEGAMPNAGSHEHDEHGYKDSGNFIVDLHGEDGSIKIGDGDDAITLTVKDGQCTGEGTITVNGVAITITGAELVEGKWQVNYNYELKENVEHENPNATGDLDITQAGVNVLVTDQDNATAKGYLTVTVHDDGPHFGLETTGGDTRLDGDFTLTFGADGKAPDALTAEGATDTKVDGNKTIFTFEDGTLTVTDKGNGNYAYEFDPKEPDKTFEKEIQLIARDSDKDTDSITITVGSNHTPDLIPPDPENPEDPKPQPVTPNMGMEVSDVTVNEANLAGGTAPDAAALTAPGSFTFNTHDEGGTLTFSFGGKEISVAVDGAGNALKDADGQDVKVEFTTGQGTFAITSISGGIVNYTFTLDKTYSNASTNDGVQTLLGENIGQQIGVELVDNVKGDSTNGVININIIDDVPEVNTVGFTPAFTTEANVQYINEDATQITGTFSNVDPKTGAVSNLAFGADAVGAKVEVSINGESFSGVVEQDAVTKALSVNFGQNSKFSMDADGNFTYKLGDKTLGKDQTDVKCEIKVTDADGDIATASGSILINHTPDLDKPDNPPVDPNPNPAKLQVSQVTVDEADLATGSGTATVAKASGSFNFDTHGEGGKLTFSFGTNPADKAEVTVDTTDSVAGPVNLPITTAYGTFVITEISNGVVKYEYTLNKTYTDGLNDNKTTVLFGDVTHEQINVTLTDAINNDPKSGIINVNIKDDVPTLSMAAETATIGDQAESITISDINITIGADIVGKDNTTATLTVAVKDHGNFEFKAELDNDGHYVFTPKEGQTGVSIAYNDKTGKYDLTYQRPEGDIETAGTPGTADTYEFTLTVKDADGDTSTDTFTVVTRPGPTITPDNPYDPDDPDNDKPANPGDRVVVDESYIQGQAGQHDGTQPDKDDTELNPNPAHAAAAMGGFKYTADSWPCTVTIGEEEGNQVVITIQADGSFKVDGDKVTGEHGYLNGFAVSGGEITYFYTQTSAFNHTANQGPDEVADADKFSVVLTDHLGNVAPSYIQVQIEDDAPVLSLDQTDNRTVTVNMGADFGEIRNEAGELVGNDKVEVFNPDGKLLVWKDADGKFVLDAEGNYLSDVDSLASGTYDGFYLEGDEYKDSYINMTVQTGDSKFTNHSYKFSLDQNAPETQEISVKATDNDGDYREVPVTLTVPTLTITEPDPDDPDEKHPSTPSGANGLIIVDEGAMAGGTGTHAEHGASGTGELVFNLNKEPAGTIEIGNETIGKCTITIQGGKVSGFDNHTITVNGVEITINQPTASTDADGNVTWVATYSYTLVANQDHDKHSEDASITDTEISGGIVPIKVTDATGENHAEGTLEVVVHDDAPELTSVTLANTGDDGLISDKLISDAADRIILNLDGLKVGADLLNGAQSAEVTVELIHTVGDGEAAEPVEYSFTVAKVGSNYEFTPAADNPDTLLSIGIVNGKYQLVYNRPADDVDNIAGKVGEDDTYTFNVKVIDADMDDAGKSITVTTTAAPHIIPDDPTKPLDQDVSSTVTTDESYIQGGTQHPDTGLTGDYKPAEVAGSADSATALGSFGVTLNGLPYTLTITGKDGSALTIKLTDKGDFDGFLDAACNAITDPAHATVSNAHGYIHDITVKVQGDKAFISYQFTQTSAFVPHEAAGSSAQDHDDKATAADSFGISLSDGKHEPVTSSIQINIEDDGPVAVADDIAIDEGAVDAITGNVLANDKYGADGEHAEQSFVWNSSSADAKYGSIVLNEDGSYEYTLNNSLDVVKELTTDQTLTETFTYTITDKDGDTSTQTLTITINGKNNPIEITPKDPDPNDENNGASANDSFVVLYDANLDNGTNPNEAALTQRGEFEINAPDGLLQVTVAGKVVWTKADGLAADRTFTTDEGTLVITGVQQDKLTYEFTLGQRGEHKDGTAGYDKNLDQIIHKFEVKVEDTDGSVNETPAFIKVIINDDVPQGTGTGQTIAIKEYGQDSSDIDISNAFDWASMPGADGVKGVSGYELDIVGGNGTKANNLLALVKDASGHVTEKNIYLYEDASGVIHGKLGGATADANGADVFTVSIDGAGKVTLNWTGAATIKHAAVQGENSAFLANQIQAFQKVVDGDGDIASASLNLNLEIVDTTPIVAYDVYKAFGSASDVTSLNFMTGKGGYGSTVTAFNGLDGTITTSTPSSIPGVHVIFFNGIKIIPTHVQYDYQKGLHIDNLYDMGSSTLKDKNGTQIEPHEDLLTNKSLVLTKDGLGMGIDQKTNGVGWEGSQIGGYEKALAAGNRGFAEAIVIEPQNGQVWYSMDVTLGQFDVANGDRAVIYFYNTPQNCNDNNIALTIEINKDTPKKANGEYLIEVPDGFTKAIIASLPNTNGKESSNFTIQKLDLAAEACNHTGIISVDQSVVPDGLDHVTWDWSAVEKVLESGTTKVTDAFGTETYRLDITATDTTVVAKLIGSSTTRHNGDVLFSGSIQANGSWSISQKYEFDHSKLDESDVNIAFTAWDKDGDKYDSTVKVDMTFDHRYHNVELGYWNKEGSNNWSYEAKYDELADVMFGEARNDLMYGRGGNDLMFGDGDEATGNALVNAMWGEGHSFEYKDYTTDTTGKENNLVANDKGDNAKAGSDANHHTASDIWTKLSDYASDKTMLNTISNDVEKGGRGAGDDTMYGGLGNDILFGGAGNDFLQGNAGVSAPTNNFSDKNIMFGGSGNDIIVHDNNEVIIHGGSGIDVLLVSGQDASGNKINQSSLDTMQKATSGTRVYDMEVMIRLENGMDVQKLGVTSLNTLQSNLGITLNSDTNQITLNNYNSAGLKIGSGWTKVGDVFQNTINGNLVTVDVAEGYTATSSNGVTVFTGNTPKVASRMAARAQTAEQASILEGIPQSMLERLANAYDVNTAATAAAIAAQLAVMIQADPAIAAQVIDEATAIEQSVSASASDVSVTEVQGTEIEVQEVEASQDFDFEEVAETGELFAGIEQAPNIALETVPETTNKADDVQREGTEANDILVGDSGNDTLLGEDGDDLLFGGAGNDFIDGGLGSDTIYAGDGDDIIVYDKSDYLIDGGSGIDFLITSEQDPNTLSDMLANWSNTNNGDYNSELPLVHDVEVMLKGVDTNDLTSMTAIAEKYGINIGNDGKGNETLTLDAGKWQQGQTNGSGDNKTTTWNHLGADGKNDGVSLETTMQQTTFGESDQLAQQVVVLTVQSEHGAV